MVFDLGPFRLYRVKKNGTLCISIKYFDHLPFGYEYGWDDIMAGERHPWISFRVGKLNLFSFETWKWGFEVWVFGFWIII